MQHIARRREQFAELSAMPISRIRYFPTAETTLIEQMGTGILFIIAWWSGRAISNFREITTIVGILDPECQLEFVVVDTDGVEELQYVPEFTGNIHGNGEVAWIRDGRIVAMSVSGEHTADFEPFTRALLAAVENES